MAYEFNGTSQRLSIPASVSSGSVPIAMSARIYPTSTTGTRSAVYLRGTDPAGQVFGNIISIGFGFPNAQKAYYIQRGQNQGTFPSVNSTASVTQNDWNHIFGQSVSLSSHQVWLNGAKTTSTTTGLSINTGFAVAAIGNDGGTGNYFSGRIADVAIWNTSLNDDEIASLAAGMTCDKVRPQSLVFYAPLVRNLIDAKGGLTITNNNTATVANHPRVYA
jgi:hypothetical protein